MTDDKLARVEPGGIEPDQAEAPDGITADGLEAMTAGGIFGVTEAEHERLVSLLPGRVSARSLAWQLGMSLVNLANHLRTMHDLGSPEARAWAQAMAATLQLMASQLSDVRDLLKGDLSDD